MDQRSIPWTVVTGFGRHIKATPHQLTIHYKGDEQVHQISSIRHLLIVGGHTIHTSALNQLLKAGSWISFFDPDGTPIGVLRPYGSRIDERVRIAQEGTLTHTYAVSIAKSSLLARLMLVEDTQRMLNRQLFMEGEQDFLIRSLDQLDYLIKLEELRRLHKLVTDMYYEIMARSLPPELGFRRRPKRPHTDPVNAMLSFGYALLFGVCCVPIIGAHLDPDLGVLRQGARSLVLDFIDPLKPRMVDELVFSIAREGLTANLYDCSSTRCILSDSLIERLLPAFHDRIKQDIIDQNIDSYRRSILNFEEFHVLH